MKTAKLKSIHLLNFKGLHDKAINFKDRTIIRGANETFKSTIMIGYLWNLFGKDDQDRPATGKGAFGIKTLDKNNNVIHNLSHEVETVWDIDGKELKLRRGLYETWARPRNEATAVLTGHEGKYWVNDVGVTLAEYKNTIENNIIDEPTFKLISNPMHFNSLNWDERRSIVFDVAGEITDIDACLSDETRFSHILAKLYEGVPLEKYMKEVKASILRLKEDLKAVPIKIKEAQRNTSEEGLPSKSDLEKRIAKATSDIVMADKAMADRFHIKDAWAEEMREVREEIQTLESKIADAKMNAMSEWREAINIKKTKLQDAKYAEVQAARKCDELNQNIESYRKRVALYDNDLELVRERYAKKRESVLNPEPVVCTECGKPLDNAEEHAEVFNARKANELNRIKEEGNSIHEKISHLKAAIIESENSLSKHETDRIEAKTLVSKLEKEIDEDKEPAPDPVFIQETEERISILRLKLKDEPSVDVSDIIEKKDKAKQESIELYQMMEKHSQIEKALDRISELKVELKDIGAELAEWEGKLDDIKEVQSIRVNMMEQSIEQKFEGVKFRMFNRQANGELDPTCIALVPGEVGLVPWHDANNAGQIKSGISISSSLSKHYGISLPLFVDNAEAIRSKNKTMEESLPETHMQMIAMYVTSDKEMVIEY